MKISAKEITGMCKKLAYKYNSERHREDMEQEGILVCYEILAQEPDAHPAKLYREAKRRMHDYLNLDTQPVSIPAHNISRRLARDLTDDVTGNMKDESRDWLRTILSAEDLPYSEDFSLSCADQVQEYEMKEQSEYVKSVVLRSLTPTELAIIKMRYYQDMTQDEVGEVLETNKMWVSRHEKVALDKLQEAFL